MRCQWYKILPRILLMLSVIGFALAAPVVVQEREVRVSGVDAAKDRKSTSPLRWNPSDKWLANAADRTNALPIPGSSDSGHWRKQEPRQHNQWPQTDSNVSPEPSNPAPPIDPHANNPLSPSPPPGPGSTSPSQTSWAPTDEPDPSNPPSPHDDSHALNPVSSSTPTHDTPPPDGSPQIASSPDRSLSFDSWLPADSHSGSASSWSSGNLRWVWDSESSSSEESHPSSLDLSSPDNNNPNSPDALLSTGESHPQSPGQIDHPPPAPPSEPGLSTRPYSPPGAGSSYGESVKNAAKILMAVSKEGFQGFRPRTYGSNAVDAAKGGVAGDH